MFSHIINDDLQLRIFEMRHAEELFNLSDCNRDYLRKWLPWVDETISVEQTRDYIQFSLNLFANNNGFNLGIFYKERIVGCIGLHSIDWDNKKTTIGYWLAEEHQGNGIITRTCQSVINYVFSELSLNRIEIRAAELNLKSRAIPERLHFSYEGLVRQAEWINDHYVDHVIYGLLKEDWKEIN
ncbi:GNAT family N-acetyltransferase [Paenibacillus endoradicis]|uniref:GNAT family N-acetyltransferase n=1 Tax=Paenibacillus endoradicis TaxID=2972487 RepID=UPI0021590CC6|nr:GNAT family protein [Paenibacillus endoradicis]MCR8656669.1 GNAT family N-acetyltransferase [Paenibacillus endoradicis]